MKKSHLLTTLTLTSLLVACSSQSGQTKSTDDSLWDKIEKKGELVVATPGTYQPTSYHDDKNNLVGYEIDMIKAIGEKLKVKVKFVELDFQSSISAVDSGRVDMFANNLDITPERQQKYNISTPYKYGVGGMIVRADGSSGIEKKDLSDWKGKKAAGEANTNFMKIAKKEGAELVTYDNSSGDVYLNDVANGRTDFIPNDYIAQKLFVDAMTKQNPNLNVKMGDVFYNPSENGIIMSKKDKSLLKKIDAAINDMKKDGSLKKLSDKYYPGFDVSQPFKAPDGSDIPVIDFTDVKDAG